MLARPYQGHNPSNQTPSQKEIEQEDGKFVMPIPQDGDDRRQKIKDEPASKERKKEEPKYVHVDLPQRMIRPMWSKSSHQTLCTAWGLSRGTGPAASLLSPRGANLF
jgi:hypothetical protein